MTERRRANRDASAMHRGTTASTHRGKDRDTGAHPHSTLRSPGTRRRLPLENLPSNAGPTRETPWNAERFVQSIVNVGSRWDRASNTNTAGRSISCLRSHEFGAKAPLSLTPLDSNASKVKL
jgi:hypothetical protein